MKYKFLMFLFVLIVSAASTATAQQNSSASTDQFLGTWTGTWDGGGATGNFQLTLNRETDGATVAKVSVSGDPAYQATLSEISFDGSKMIGKYDFPPQPETEVLLVASFDGNAATGTWSLREKASGFEVVGGHMTVTKN